MSAFFVVSLQQNLISTKMDTNTILKEFERIDNEVIKLRDERKAIKESYVKHLNEKYNHLIGKKVICKYGVYSNQEEIGFFEGFYAPYNTIVKTGVEPLVYKIKKDGTPSKNKIAFYTTHPNFIIEEAE